MKYTGSRIVIECLRENNVDTVFGYPGGAILPLYDALRDAPLRHILTVHEQGAAHAADGYARASGRVGVCIATSGPGATNLVTGLATAYMDSVPVVAITGQVGTPLLGRDAFQGVDVTGVTMPITKHNILVQDIHELAEMIREAFAIAREGRPGPVLIDIPRDILTAECEFHSQTKALQYCGDNFATPDRPTLQQAVELIQASKQPVLIVGGGIKAGKAHETAVNLAELCNIPVVSTLMGLGTFSAANRQFLGLTGMHGQRPANQAVANADLIIAVSTRFSDRVTGDRSQYVAGKTIIHFDIDAGEVGRNIAANVEFIGNLDMNIACLIQELSTIPPLQFSAWWEQIDQWRNDAYELTNDESLNPKWIMQHMSQATATNPVIWTTDVGQHQMWAAQHLSVNQPRSWITSGGMGTMGFGLPAAMGAQLACPGTQVVAICGDGGFKMTGMELYTIASNNIPLICVIIDNHMLGMVRQLQHVFCEERYMSVSLPPFDFVGFARICGVRSQSANTPAEFAAAFARALTHPGPSVIVVDIAANLMVDPMVQPGRSIDQFVDFKPAQEEVA
jgi:acetolactate synthase-1/2/3 large subunit